MKREGGRSRRREEEMVNWEGQEEGEEERELKEDG
jgi:hypothetical protein